MGASRRCPRSTAFTGWRNCGGRWRIDDSERTRPPQEVSDALAAVLDAPDEATRQAPAWRVRPATDTRPVAVLDCDGQVLLELPAVEDVDGVDGGLLGTFAGEHSPRLWWDGASTHTVPVGMAIDDDHVVPPLLLLWDAAAGENHLYNLDLGRVVGRGFSGVTHMDGRRVVFRRNGQLGLMLADGSEPVLPVHMEILPWGEDRTWTRRYLDGGGEELTLLDAQHRVVLRRRLLFTGVELESTWQGDAQGHALTRLNLGTMRIDGRRYFAQQWLDRDGKAVLSEVSCAPPGDAPVSQGKGALLGPDWRLDSTPGQACQLPQALIEVLDGGDVDAAITDG